MDEKQSWISQFFKRFLGHKSAEQSNTPPARQAPSEGASPPRDNVSSKASSEPPAPVAPTARPNKVVSSANNILVGRRGERAPAVWKVGDVITIEKELTFEVVGQLGEGGMGLVYKVYDRHHNHNLAMKCPKPEIFVKAGGKENFIQEAQTWIKLGEYPHIVNCDFVKMLDDLPLIFAEYVDGGSLADWIRWRILYRGGSEQALQRMLDVAIQTAWGLHYAHEQGLVHQDVKPANILMTTSSIAKVTDFGLAKARAVAGEEQMPRTGQSILVSWGGMTPAYCSPEQAAKRPLGRKTDIWSWAVSMLEMFVGEVTWMAGGLAREVLASHQRQDVIIPIMPPELVKLLGHCLQPRSEDRPPTMLEVAGDLLVIYERLTRQPYPREMPKAAQRGANTRFYQAYSLSQLGNKEEALAAYEEAIRLDPTDALAYNNKGNVLQALGQYEEARVAFDEAIRLDPTHADAYCNKGTVLQSLGRYEEAIVVYDEAIRLDPTNADAYSNKGSALQHLGRYEEAIVACDEAIRLDPTHANAYNHKGLALKDLGRYEEAIVAYDESIRFDPTFAGAYYNKGNALRKLERYEEAIVADEKTIQLDPTIASAYYNKGVTLEHLGRYEEAIVAYDQAIRLDPTYTNAYYNKGNSLRDLGQYEEAIFAYDKAIQLDPTFAAAYHGKGLMLQDLGQYKEAIVAYDQAIRLDPTFALAYYSKGLVLGMLRRYKEAIVAFDEAIRLNPTDAAAYYTKGITLQYLGRITEAKRAFQKAQELGYRG
jgi:tetratricopeptide (TPR) repeat protein